MSDYPPTECDFDSVWKEQPERRENLDPCLGRGLSVFDTAEEAEKRRSYNTLRDKVVCEVIIPPDSGFILKTGTHHYTWWPWRSYDILASFEEQSL